jgi:hypothetical protein
MKILERLSMGLTLRPQAAPAGETRALTFATRLRRMSPLRAASWRQLLRLNRQAQVDPLIAPPVPPPGHSSGDAAAERGFLRAAVDRRLAWVRSGDVPPGLDGRRQVVERMLSLLGEQQSQQDMIAAQSARAGSEWR